MRRVPRLGRCVVAQAHAVVMADDGAAFAARRPVFAGLLRRRAVGIGAGKDVVAVGLVATAVDHVARLVQRGRLGDAVGVRMQRGDVVRDLLALLVVPRAAADPVPRVHAACREIGVPGLFAAARRLGQRLAMRVGALQPAEIGTVARPGTGYEEAHRLVLRRCGKTSQRGEKKHCGKCRNGSFHHCLLHGGTPDPSG